jgi:cyclopropane fatty-acyl-phospholipid synthase-like methyltransferase/DUF1365 family protein
VNWLYDIEVTHQRGGPIRHQVRHSSYQWLVDLDALPRLPRGLGGLARFEARDHLGDPDRSIRDNVEDFLAQHGIDLDGGQITMLANARSAGYVFNPLSLFWCHRPDGELAAVVAEVHNTYGERHAYLLRPDETGQAETLKDFRVSPFYPVDGFYRLNVPEPGQRLAVTITLHRPEGPPFVASVRGGHRRAVTTRAVLSTVARRPLATWRVRAAITVHGLALYLKGLPVQHTTSPATPAKATVASRLADTFRTLTGAPLPIRLRAWDGSIAGPDDGPTLVIRSRRALRRVAWRPDEIGLARAYVTGELDVEGDLTEGFRRIWAVARDRGASAAAPSGGTRRLAAARTALRLGLIGPPPAAPAGEARLSGRAHTRRRDRAGIAHHYDLSNDFYALLLGESMAYSSAYYTEGDQSLLSAQRDKLDLICRKLELSDGSRLLDVGCGWGSLILHAASLYGAHATGVTLSAAQHDYVQKQVAERGLADLVEVRLMDYRDLDSSIGQFDAVSSIEMGEHVGDENYPTYAAILADRLVPGGRLVLQQMSRRADAAPGGGPFIESYIAPDMHMRPLPSSLAYLQEAGFEIRSVEAMREHYVRTVHAWLATFEEHYDEVVAMLGVEGARAWRLYLVGGACSFAEGRMGVDQVLATR